VPASEKQNAFYLALPGWQGKAPPLNRAPSLLAPVCQRVFVVGHKSALTAWSAPGRAGAKINQAYEAGSLVLQQRHQPPSIPSLNRVRYENPCQWRKEKQEARVPREDQASQSSECRNSPAESLNPATNVRQATNPRWRDLADVFVMRSIT